MTKPSPHHVDAARRLLAYEMGTHADEGAALAAGRVHDRLFESLAPIIGAAGVRALFVRSVRLGMTEHPRLEAMLGAQDGHGAQMEHGQRLVACLVELESGAAREVAVTLYAVLLDLMTRFIGERMVWRIVCSAFPAIDIPGLKEND